MAEMVRVVEQIDPMHTVKVGDKFQIGERDHWWEVVEVTPVMAGDLMVDGGWLTPKKVNVTLRAVAE